MALRQVKWIVALVCCVALSATVGIAGSSREVLNFNTGWKWIDSDVEGGESVGLDESGALDVSLPHSTVLLDLFKVNPEEWRKVTWYRRHFSLPAEHKGRRVNVLFQGAGQVNTVYVNGMRVGEAKGYFTPFDFDIQDHVKFGGADNVIAVRVDSTEHPEMPPTGSDFHYFGGIHRDAIMTICDAVNVDDAFVWTEPADKGVRLNARVCVINGSEKPRSVQLSTSLLDADEKSVSSTSAGAVTIAPGKTHCFELTHAIENPHLWSLNDPYLHEFVSRVRVDGDVVDEHKVTTGLRWVTADPQNTEGARIYLNGKKVRLFGVNRHEQYPYIGNAGPNRYHRRDAHLIKYGAGCDLVRTSHYTNDPDFIDECDRVGLLVVAENMGWQTVKDDYWKQVYEETLAEMVRRYRNHPSIIMWSVIVNEGPPNLLDWERKLNTMVKEIDPTRLTADHTNKNKAEFITDVWNRHCYTPDGKIIDVVYQPCVVGEFNNRLGSNFVVPNDNESRKLNMILQDGIKANLLWGNPKIAGIIRWDAFGYITPNNAEEYGRCNQHKNFGEYRNSGIYGCYRNRRYLADWWQAQAKPEQVGDVVHILTEWKRDSSSTVYVASNADEVELFRGDKSFGRIKPNLYTDMRQGLFQFDDVKWWRGSKLIAKAFRGGKVVAETVRYATSYGNETKLELTSKTGDAIVADGSDMAWIEARILDKNGQVSDYADANLTITTLDGPATAIHKTTPIQFQNPPEDSGLDSIQMTDGYGVFHLRSRLGQPGSIKVVAEADVGVSVDNNQKNGPAKISYYPKEAWKVVKRPEAYGGYVRMVQGKKEWKCRVEIRFTGEQIRLYGGRAYEFGNALVTIDGGHERMIDVCTEATKRRENMLLYTSPKLPAGEHVMTITPKFRKKWDEKKIHKKAQGPNTSFGFSLDRVKIMDGKADLKSDPIVIRSTPITCKTVPGGAR